MMEYLGLIILFVVTIPVGFVMYCQQLSDNAKKDRYPRDAVPN